MAYEIIPIWKAHGDGGERSRGPVVGYAMTQDDAHRLADGRGWWGGNGGTSEGFAIKIDGTLYALEQKEAIVLEKVAAELKAKDDSLRKRTLASLTAEQKRVLGLKD
jgi:hypothetical protein